MDDSNKVLIGISEWGEEYYLDKSTGKVWQYGGDQDNVYPSMNDLPEHAQKTIGSYMRRHGLVAETVPVIENKKMVIVHSEEGARKKVAELSKRFPTAKFYAVGSERLGHWQIRTQKGIHIGSSKSSLKSNRGQGGWFKERKPHSIARKRAWRTRGR